MKINHSIPSQQPYLHILSTMVGGPKKLFYTGILPLERQPTVAIVGSRKPTSYGKEVTYQLSFDLAKHGIIVISGLALGVDAIAHRAALDAGGITLAVVANGVDVIYPATNKNLGEDIVTHGGAIVSEYEPGIAARDFQFLARNRIVSGLADAIIVTEAAIRSGTLSTVTHALAQGRDVFVVPGNITSPMSAGCNALIKQGANPITCAQDVLQVIAPDRLQRQQTLALGDTPLQSAIISLIKEGIRDGDALQSRTQVSSSEFSQALTLLEISGTIRSLGGNQWTLR